jgi:hypothetical protein
VRNRGRSTAAVSHRRHTLDLREQFPQVRLRRVFFVNHENSKYVSVGYYPARFYYALIEFFCANHLPVIIKEQHLTTLFERLPELCEAMCRGERYTFRDGVFRLLYRGGNQAVARMCLDKRYILFKLMELRYLMNMLNIVQEQVSTFTNARDDVRSYAACADGYTDFVEPNPLISSDIPYVGLFNELKMSLI